MGSNGSGVTVSDVSVVAIPAPDAESTRAVRVSIRRIAGRESELSELFYQHLFKMIPEVRRLFPDDMTEQRARLLAALLASVDALDDPIRMESDLLAMGEVHYYRGIEDHQYQYVAHALIRSVRELIPYEWSSELSSAWIAVYTWMITHMVTGAQYARAQAEAGLAARPAVHLDASSYQHTAQQAVQIPGPARFPAPPSATVNDQSRSSLSGLFRRNR
jgi:hemoglobin-like flavoprotein